jgi:hypothetical protein
MKDYAKIVGQAPVSPRPENRSSAASPVRRPLQQQQQPTSRNPSGSKTGLWVLVILGVLVVLFSAYRQHMHRQGMQSADHSVKTAQTDQATSPQYDFYSVLPSGNNPAASPAAASTSASAAAPTATACLLYTSPSPRDH